ncbi:MAG: AAA family ATPase [Endomicrobium sp.]|jgi:AAA+ ATPase superfamily predicted ATPase|uniref:ATP-binding protein n=1 Tax=Candidatus Endomicrobiellum cubanum TaxID=3242325 RepID=UPI0028315F20|nr:AAA family ATPase [Endomicrobium sp.]
MKFYDRKEEFEILKELNKVSKKSSSFALLIGRRRLGKTALLLESAKTQKEKFLYLFVARQNEAVLCKQFQQEVKNVLGLEIFGEIKNFRKLFESLMKFAKDTPYTLVIDEFQEFERVNPSIFSDIQNLWDRYKDETKLNLIVCGSIYSMLVKIFENSKIILKPFKIEIIKQILKDNNRKYTPDDLLCLYMLTGGVPKYISVLMDAKAVSKSKMIDHVVRTDSLFLSEGKDILISELGKDYGTYFSILQLISNGKNTQSEIDSIIEKNTGAYLLNLEKKFSLLSRKKPIFSKPESRNTHWQINDNYLSFYFRFLYPNQYLIEQEQFTLLKEIIMKNYEQYSGQVLENYFKDKLSQDGKWTNLGSYWDNKGENEIDVVAVNDLNKTAIVAEVKRNSKKINYDLVMAKFTKISTQLKNYKIEFQGLSLENM